VIAQPTTCGLIDPIYAAPTGGLVLDNKRTRLRNGAPFRIKRWLACERGYLRASVETT
jgi:hypothetical protein